MLLQEKDLNTTDGPWKLLVSCILLNLTSRSKAEPIFDELLEFFPNPESVSFEDYSALVGMLKKLGLSTVRASHIIGMSRDYVRAKAKFGEDYKMFPVGKFRGCGKYAQDSWDVVLLQRLKPFVTDHALIGYIKSRSE